MVEGGAKQVSESVVLEALRFGHGEIMKLIEAQEKLVAKRRQDQARAAASRRATRSSSARSRALALDASARPAESARRSSGTRRSTRSTPRCVATLVTPFRERAARALRRWPQVEAAQSAGRKLAGEVKDILHDLRGTRDARRHPRRQAAHRRALDHRHPADQLQRLGAARPARLGAVHARRDPGAGQRSRSAASATSR